MRRTVGEWSRRYGVVQWLRLWLQFNRRLRDQLSRQLRSRGSAMQARPFEGLRVLVPLIETAHYQYLQILIIAKALQLRGAHVKVLICGATLEGCEIKSARNPSSDPCVTCRFNDKHVVSLFDLDVVRLADYIDEGERDAIRREAAALAHAPQSPLSRDGLDLSRMVEDSVRRYFYGAMPLEGPLLQRVRADHIASALLTLKVAQRIIEVWRPDVVYTHMFAYTAWEPYVRWFKRCGVPFTTISISPLNYRSVVVGALDLYVSRDRFSKYVEARGGRPLNASERQELNEYMRSRTSGSADAFREARFFETQSNLRAQLGIDSSKRNIFLFSNVYWDVGMSDCGDVFDDVVSWVLGTIEIVQRHPDCHLYIKPHPAEVFDSAPSEKGIRDFVHERFPQLPPNVSIIDPERRVRTYDLFPFIDAGIVFNGTLGLEMMLAGVPVVVTGRAPYGELGFALEPDSLEAYEGALSGTLAPVEVDRERLELFAYFYFLRTHMPWNLTKRAYADNFDGFAIENLDDLAPGRDPHLDHLCNCIARPAETVVEAWPDERT